MDMDNSDERSAKADSKGNVPASDKLVPRAQVQQFTERLKSYSDTCAEARKKIEEVSEEVKKKEICCKEYE